MNLIRGFYHELNHQKGQMNKPDGFYWVKLTVRWEVVEVCNYDVINCKDGTSYSPPTAVYVAGCDMDYSLDEVKEWGPKIEPPNGDGGG